MWEELSIEDNVLFINKKLIEGLTMKQIEQQYYNVGERVIAKRLAKRGFKRSYEGNRLFVLDSGVKPHTEPISTTVEGVNAKANKQLTNEELKTIKLLIDNYSKIEQLINNYSNANSVSDDIVRVSDGQIRSWKVSKSTLDKLNTFSKNSVYGIGDIVNSSILYFINAHK